MKLQHYPPLRVGEEMTYIGNLHPRGTKVLVYEVNKNTFKVRTVSRNIFITWFTNDLEKIFIRGHYKE